jgi:DNA-binding transcriptional regulator LsrR (DeoR family)
VNNRNELQLMVQIARLYYENGLTQEQIAEKLQMYRQRVARLLTSAREEGIVSVNIHDPTPIEPGLIRELQDRFHIHDAIITSSEGLDSNLLRSQLGLAAAAHLVNVPKASDLVGIGWGRTLYEAVNSLPKDRKVPIHVVPMIGGIGDMTPYFQVNELARRMADAFGGTYRSIYAPAFTQDASIVESLNKTQEVEQMVNLWQSLDIAVVGIGHVEFQQMSSMFFADHISPVVLAQLEAGGAVGDICGRFYNIQGEQIRGPAGVIGISIEQLQHIPEVIAVGGGLEKVRALLGALRSGFIKTLVTDSTTARAVLIESEERR